MRVRQSGRLNSEDGKVVTSEAIMVKKLLIWQLEPGKLSVILFYSDKLCVFFKRKKRQ